MGSWDVSSFGNEQAEGWLVNLLCGGTAQPIFKALTVAAKMTGDDYMQANDAEEAVAAAEVLAAALGMPSEDLPPEVEQWLANHSFAAGAEIVDMAVRVIERISSNSELKELWQDTDSAEDWLHVVNDLQTRLRRSETYIQGMATKEIRPAPARSANELFEQALKCVSAGEHDSAVAIYNEALEVDPTSQLAYLGRGTCYLSLGKYQDAVEDFDKSFTFGKEVLEAYYLRAQAYFHLEMYDECIDDLSQMIAKKSDNWNAFWIRGIAYESLALYLKASGDFSRVIELEPAYEEAYLRRANCYEKLGSFDRANKDREKVKNISRHS